MQLQHKAPELITCEGDQRNRSPRPRLSRVLSMSRAQRMTGGAGQAALQLRRLGAAEAQQWEEQQYAEKEAAIHTAAGRLLSGRVSLTAAPAARSSHVVG